MTGFDPRTRAPARRLLLGALIAALACFGAAGVALAAPPPDSLQAHPPFHLKVRTGNLISPSAATPEGLTPTQIRSIYNLPSSGGTGTIALIDAYDNAGAESDLGVFDTEFGLPSCTTANGCFTKYKMSTHLSSNSGWALESSLDVQWAHTVAPGAKILLVEAKSSSVNDLLAAVDYARSLPSVVAVSMSWGSAEFSGQAADDSHFVSPYGAAFFASTGDSGAGVEWPSTSANVVAVGGTMLNFVSNIFSSETAWSGSGGGVSAYTTEPSYQSLYGISGTGGYRAVPDVSYDADPNSGFSVYDSTSYSGQSGWLVVGGTSAGSPQWAAIYALGGTADNSTLYPTASSPTYYASDFRDITSGTNGSCGASCAAGVGYDLVTGLGSPLTTDFTVPVTYADITEAAGGVDVSIDTTSDGGSSAWTTLTGPSIAETAPGQIAAGTHTLTLPAGWEFNTGQNVSISIGGGTSLALAATSIAPGATALSFIVTANSTSGNATLTFSNLEVRPTATLAPSLGTITHSGAAISGVDGSTSFGSLSTDAGAPTALGLESSPSGAGSVVAAQSLASGTSTTAYAITRDQFGNFVANVPASWSLVAETGGVAGGDLTPSDDTESAVFSANLAGSCQIEAAVGGFANADSGTITVVPGAITSIALSPHEATTTADAAQSYAVTGADALGNTLDLTASSTFSISGGAGGSFAGAVYTPQNAGDWTASTSYESFSDQAVLHVVAGAANLLTFASEPAGAQAGATLPDFTVGIEDLRGNLIGDATSSISIAIGTNPGAGTLTGTTAENAVDGVATFGGLSIDTASAGYTLVASASGLASATSSAFAITAPPSCSPSSVSNGSVASYPSCAINCNAGYALSGSSCVASGGGHGGGGGGGSSGGSSGSDAVTSIPSTAKGVASTTPLTAPAAVVIPALAPASGLSSTQVEAILGLLVSFGADQSVIDKVEAALSGSGESAQAGATQSSSFTRDLTLGTQGADVEALQQYLITQSTGPAAAALAASGASGYFGALTRAALIEFQKARDILPAAGYFGPKTRALLGS